MIRKIWGLITLGITLIVYGSISIAYPPAYDYLAPRWARLLLKALKIKLNVHGFDNLDPKKSAIYVINHESALDPVVAMATLPIKLRSLAKKELFSLPLLGWIMTLARHIPVDRQNPKRAIDVINRTSKEIIRKNISILVSPEGTRSRDGRLGRFKKGAFKLAEKFNLPIIPVILIGTGKCLPTKTLDIRPGVVELYIDKPLYVSNFPSLEDCIDYVRKLMIKLKDKHGYPEEI